MLEYDKRLEVIATESEELKEKIELVEVECENLGKEIAEKSKAKKNLDSQTQKLENEKIDSTHKLDKLKEGLKGNEHERKHYEHQQSQLKLHDIKSLENGCMVEDENSQNSSSMIPKEEKLKIYEEDDLGKSISLFI